MRQFTLEISYSQIAVFNAGLRDPFNHWTDDHFNQGFCWRDGSVAFRTAGKAGQGKISVETVQDRAIRDDAILAISVPFHLPGNQLEVASIHKSEIIDFEPGDYELVYQTGRHGVVPWVALQFIARKVETASILKGIEHLKPPPELVMTAEPA